MLVSAGVFLALALAVLLLEPFPGDAAARLWVLGYESPALVQVMRVINYLGNWRVLFPATVLLVFAFPKARARWWIWVGLMLAAPSAEGLLKILIARARPEEVSVGLPERPRDGRGGLLRRPDLSGGCAAPAGPCGRAGGQRAPDRARVRGPHHPARPLAGRHARRRGARPGAGLARQPPGRSPRARRRDAYLTNWSRASGGRTSVPENSKVTMTSTEALPPSPWHPIAARVGLPRSP
jgi:hypothetical protein